MRKIEQDEKLLNDVLRKQAGKLLETRIAGLPEAEAEALLTSFQKYLKAKLCGRWPNGARMKPEQEFEPAEPTWEELQADAEFNFKDDPDGFGCPFGAHIRRTSPRGDKVLPLRRRPLFRRGMPYGERSPTEQRGLIGLFFCSSIEDQFEHVMSEWVEKMPMGPPSRGNAKDPLVGNNDDRELTFHIPVPRGPGFSLDGFAPFVTTHGTLYALFPSRDALCEIAGIEPHTSQVRSRPLRREA